MLFVLCVIASWTLASGAVPPPGKVFDLSAWLLQLPLSDGNGNVIQISQPALATYTSEYFYTDASDNGMTFWAPINGAHTPGSLYPRSELREVKDWTFKGTNEMNVVIQVMTVPTNGKITIAQIHVDGVSGSCSIIEELEWENGTIVANQRDKNCKEVSAIVGHYTLNQKVTVSLSLVGQQLTVKTDQTQYQYTYSWMNTSVPIYFKTGDYVQESGSSATIGGKTKISKLSISHA